jgi:glycosyltransferase involved in cell wall biosynthesis
MEYFPLGKILIDYTCFLHQFSGYATAARNMIEALIESKEYDIKLTAIDENKRTRNIFYPNSWNKLKDKPQDSNRILILHCIPNMYRRMFKSRRKLKSVIGVATFETINPPKIWINGLKKMNAVMVPSMFNYHEFAKYIDSEKIFYVPHTINWDQYTFQPYQPKSPFTFLWIGSWRERKGYKKLFKAFKDEFQDQNVKLMIRTDKPEMAQSYIRQHHIDNIVIHRGTLTHEEMPSMMRQADCIVLPTMGEGFGLVGLQAMALGLPLISPEHSGCQEYANTNTSFILDISEITKIPFLDRIPQFQDCLWHQIAVSSLRKQMRFVLENPVLAAQKAKIAREHVYSKFSYDVVLGKFRQMIDFIA